MKLNQTELKALYTTLKEMCTNSNLSDIPMFKDGNKLVPNYKNGSKIHIKKKNRGKFTASAKRAGQSVQEHARSVLNNPNATPLQKKRANFARNAAKWKHQKGGVISSALYNRMGSMQYDLQDLKKRLGMIKSGEFKQGNFGGGGAGTNFIKSPDYEYIDKKDTLYLPIQRTFNDAFAEARRDSLPEFTFNGKKYTTEIGDNPLNNKVGNARVETVEILPIEYKKRVKVKNENIK